MHISNPRILSGRFSRPIIYTGLFVILFFMFGDRVFPAFFDNGFNIEDPLVPADEIHHGGPPRDGIPAIDKPVFVSVDEADFLTDKDRILGLSKDGTAKAYPVRILDFHEIVNDDFNGEAVVVSYCPLCGSGMAFDANVAGEARSFGVSGLLYNSDVLLYDRESESLWSQIMRKSVSGPLKGQDLVQIPMAHTTWRDWREHHPDTIVLSNQTGYSRDYSHSPYAGYELSNRVWFPVKNKSQKYHPKELIIGVNVDGNIKAYPFTELSKGPNKITDTLGQTDLRIEFDSGNRTGRILDMDGNEIPSTIAFWFAWYAFFPDTEVYALN